VLGTKQLPVCYTELMFLFPFLPLTAEEVNAIALDVCLSVCQQDYSKMRAWIWMTFCVSTDVGTWTNCSDFERDPDDSPDAGTGLFSAISYALQRRIIT